MHQRKVARSIACLLKKPGVISTKWLTGRRHGLCCYYYFKIKPSPEWLTERLRAFLYFFARRVPYSNTPVVESNTYMYCMRAR